MTMRAFAGIILSSFLCSAAFAQSSDTAPTFEVADVHVSPQRVNQPAIRRDGEQEQIRMLN
jgi:hypothetical protein